MAMSKLGAPEQARWRFRGDEEDSPWMVGTDLHLKAVIALLQALRRALDVQQGPWYVSGEMFVHYGPAAGDHVAPDVYAAQVANYPRDTYHVAREGRFPPFVLEVISSSSWERDAEEKAQIYETLGALEYVLFDPTREGLRRGGPAPGGEAELWGYRRDEWGAFTPWTVDATGALRSAVLGGIELRVEGSRLRVLSHTGDPVLFDDELDAARQEAEAGRAAAEVARQEAEQEVERLRAELRRHGLA